MEKKLRKIIAGFLVVFGIGIVGSADPRIAPLAGFSAVPAQAQDGIRLVEDVCSWDDVAWSDMNSAEQDAWAALGWTAKSWEGSAGDAPASKAKDWKDLTQDEQDAALDLGYTEELWNDDGCS